MAFVDIGCRQIWCHHESIPIDNAVCLTPNHAPFPHPQYSSSCCLQIPDHVFPSTWPGMSWQPVTLNIASRPSGWQVVAVHAATAAERCSIIHATSSRISLSLIPAATPMFRSRTSTSIQPTARAPREIPGGNLPSAMAKYMVELEKPVIASTFGRRYISIPRGGYRPLVPTRFESFSFTVVSSHVLQRTEERLQRRRETGVLHKSYRFLVQLRNRDLNR